MNTTLTLLRSIKTYNNFVDTFLDPIQNKTFKANQAVKSFIEELDEIDEAERKAVKALKI